MLPGIETYANNSAATYLQHTLQTPPRQHITEQTVAHNQTHHEHNQNDTAEADSRHREDPQECERPDSQNGL